MRTSSGAEVHDSLLLIGGFVLAHAAYSICDAGRDELLIPLVVAEIDGKREVMRFEADTQEEAVAAAQSALVGLKASADIYAFAREGIWREADGSGTDVFLVEAWTRDSQVNVSVIQPFRPNQGVGAFRLVATIEVAVNGTMLEGDSLTECSRIVAEGIAMHPRGGQWQAWQSGA
jgi:hypothetical protein